MKSIRHLSTKTSLLTTRRSSFSSARASAGTSDESVSQFQPVMPKALSPLETVLKYVCGIPLSPLGIFTVRNNHSCVMFRFGKYERTATEGLRFRLPFGSDTTSVFMGTQSFKLPDAKVVDKKGNPIIISAIVNYQVKLPENFVINIKASNQYIHNQAEAVIKQIASKYPYDSDDGINLKDEISEISDEMREELQNLVNHAGIEITNVYLTDLNYAPEIAQSMLIKQQAEAYIDAKTTIATSSVGIIKETIQNIEQLGINLDDQSKNKLVCNLVTVIASGNSVQPTISV